MLTDRGIKVLIFIWILFSLSVSLGACFVPNIQRLEDQSLSEPAEINSLKAEDLGEAVQISILADRPFSYSISNHEKPFRLRIDLPGVHFGDLPSEMPVNKGPVKTMEVIRGQGLGEGGRVEITFEEKVGYKITKEANYLLVAIPKSARPAAPLPPKAMERAPSPMASLLPAKEQDYLIGGRDILNVTVYNERDLTKNLRVSSQGTISFPLVGTVKVAGLTPAQLEKKLEELLRQGYLKDPQVSVLVVEYRSKEVFVLGAVQKPGTYPLTGPATLLEMISRAGGVITSVPTGREAVGRAGKRLFLLRPRGEEGQPSDPGELEYLEIDLERLLDKGDMSLNLPVRDKDTLYVPLAESVYVFGKVKLPGPYELLKKEVTVLEAIAMAGGFLETAAPNRVQLIRVEEGEKRVINVRVDDIARRGNKSHNIFVKDGDVIIVPESFF